MEVSMDESIHVIHIDFDGFQGIEGRLQIMQAPMDGSMRGGERRRMKMTDEDDG